MFASANSNCANSLLNMMDSFPLGEEITFLAAQETKVPLSEMDHHEGKFAAAGWQASFQPCLNSGKEASCGVALLGREGTSFSPLYSADVGIHIPNSPRVGFWTVAECFKGGFIAVVL